MKKYLFSATILSILILPILIMAQSPSPTINPGTLPDSPFYFLKIWKEKIQTFFTFGAENKAKQYFHLAEVRFAEYQKMIQEGKDQIASQTLGKYQDQLDRAISKMQELEQKGKDLKNLPNQIQESIKNNVQVLQENLQRLPEQARQGIERALDNSKNKIQKFEGKNEPTPTITPINPTPTPDETANWKTYKNEQYGFELRYPRGVVNVIPHIIPRGTNFELPNGNFIEADGFVYFSPQESILDFAIFKKALSGLGQYVASEVSRIQGLKSTRDQNLNVSYQKIDIGGVDAYQINYRFPLYSKNRVFIQNLEHVFMFDYSVQGPFWAERIIATLKFTK